MWSGHHPNSLTGTFLPQLVKRDVAMMCHHVEEEHSDPNILPLLREIESDDGKEDDGRAAAAVAAGTGLQLRPGDP